MATLSLLEPTIFDNKYKIFDIKYNPVNHNQLSLVDFKGRLRILTNEDNNFDVTFNYKISSESIHSLNYSDNGESKKIRLTQSAYMR
jgi:hypothetical protein